MIIEQVLEEEKFRRERRENELEERQVLVIEQSMYYYTNTLNFEHA